MIGYSARRLVRNPSLVQPLAPVALVASPDWVAPADRDTTLDSAATVSVTATDATGERAVAVEQASDQEQIEAARDEAATSRTPPRESWVDQAVTYVPEPSCLPLLAVMAVVTLCRRRRAKD